MQAPLLYNTYSQKLWLTARRAIYWEDQQTLILSDLHFGKTGHFRKSGIAVPQSVYKEDLQRLVELIRFFNPKKLLVVGDFFHSHANPELEWFRKWRTDFSDLPIVLVRGNHDILQQQWYRQAEIEVIEKELRIGNFLFTHEKCEDREGMYTFCGHLHPGISLHGLGKQSLRFPCFYFAQTHCTLPAFSRFTGTVSVRPLPDEHVFAIVENSILQIQ